MLHQAPETEKTCLSRKWNEDMDPSKVKKAVLIAINS